MAYPAYVDNGGIAADNNELFLDIPYPGTVNANDVLITIIGIDDDDVFIFPNGWYLGGALRGTYFSVSWYWNRAAGTESGTERWQVGVDNGKTLAGVMLRFSGCVTAGNPYGANTSAGISQGTTGAISDITTLGADRLCVCLAGIEDDTGTSDDAVSYSEIVDVTTAVGNGMGFSVFSYQKAAAGAVGADSFTIGGTDYWGTHTLALRDSVPSGYANDVLGVGTADIGGVTTVDTADISEVIGV